MVRLWSEAEKHLADGERPFGQSQHRVHRRAAKLRACRSDCSSIEHGYRRKAGVGMSQ
jgi:hypothetical protein